MTKITMYSTGACPFCQMAERLLRSKGIAAIDKVRVDLEPERRVDVVPVTVWDPDPELEVLEAGRRVWLCGAVQRRFWEGPEGRRSRIEVVAHEVDVRLPDRAGEVVS